MKNYIKKYLKIFLDKKYRRYASNISGTINIFPLIDKIIRSSVNSSDRVLVVYDLSVQPFSIGDFLLAQEVGQILCLKNSVKFVDIAVILDPSKPKSSDPAFSSINSSNYLFNFSAIFPIVQLNKNIGSIFVFNSSLQFMKFLKGAGKYATIWPSLKNIFLTKRYLHYIAFDEIIYPYYKDFKSLPSLEPIKFLQDWAGNFMNKFCSGKIIITINFRNNQSFHSERNLDAGIWRQFFLSYEERKDLIFLLVCARDEIDAGLRECPNVIFAKDHDTTVDQDLALISVGHIHMGSSSGPASVAWFSSNKPYFIVRLTMDPKDFETPCLLDMEDGFYRFSFANQYQTFYSGRETLSLLRMKLEEMLGAVEFDSSNISYQVEDPTLQNWLR